MTRKQIIFMLCGGLIVIFVVYIVYQFDLARNLEHEIFCERLQAGMSEEEVIDILEEYGEIFANDTRISADFDIYIYFIDRRINGQKLYFFRSEYVLNFWKGSYDGTFYWVSLDQTRSPCE